MMAMIGTLSRLTKFVYAQQFLTACMVIYPYYAIMFSERSHLTTPQISALFGWWIVVALVSELPTGTLADKFSRRTVIILSDVLQALAFAAWLLMPNFVGYAVGFLFWGVGFAFNSGAFQAYVFDELKALHKQYLFTKIYSRSQSMNFAGMLTAYLVASVIGRRYPLVLVLSILVSLVSAGVAGLFPKQVLVTKSSAVTGNVSQVAVLRYAVLEVVSSKLLCRLVLSVAVAVAIGSAMEEYVPLYDKIVGVPVRIVPLVLAFGLGLSALLAWVAHHFESRTRLFGVLALGLAGVALFATSYGGTILAAGGIMLFMRLVKMTSLLYQSSLQHYIGEENRATVGSLPNFIAELFSLLLVAMYGFVAKAHGNFGSIRTIAVIVVAAGLALAWFWKKYHLRVAKIEPEAVGEIPEMGISA